jgi:hypothetical protein
MPTHSKAGQILSYSLSAGFANGGVISKDAFEFITNLALEDQVVDDDEKNVLQVIFDRADPRKLSLEVRGEMAEFRRVHGF